jgi:tight adherence protein C
MELINLQIMLPVLAFVAVVGLGGAVIVARVLRLRPIQARLQAGVTELAPVSEHGQPSFFKALHGLGTVVAPKPSKGLREVLAKAGFYGHHAPHIFLGIKILSFTIVLAIMLAIVPPLPSAIPVSLKVLLILIGATCGMIAPNFVVSGRRLRRQAEVRRHLPDAVDLLEISVSAGMGLDQAWRAVAEQVRRVSPILADEMSLTDLEINLGAARATALRHMADRTSAEELHWLVSAFIQSDRFGTSLSETLRAFAGAMREDRTRKAEEGAEKMAVRILFPLVLFIFPTIIIVCAGPAGIKIATVFGGQ